MPCQGRSVPSPRCPAGNGDIPEPPFTKLISSSPSPGPDFGDVANSESPHMEKSPFCPTPCPVPAFPVPLPARDPLERGRSWRWAARAAATGPGRWQAGHGTSCRKPPWGAFVLLPGASLSGFQDVRGSLGAGEALLGWGKHPTFPREGSGWCPVLFWHHPGTGWTRLWSFWGWISPLKILPSTKKRRRKSQVGQKAEQGGDGDVRVQGGGRNPIQPSGCIIYSPISYS